MIDVWSLAIGASVGFIVSFAISSLIVAAGDDTHTERLKEENDRLNRKLHVLTDRDERGRFRGGKK
jgi:hypothetical protein